MTFRFREILKVSVRAGAPPLRNTNVPSSIRAWPDSGEAAKGADMTATIINNPGGSRMVLNLPRFARWGSVRWGGLEDAVADSRIDPLVKRSTLLGGGQSGSPDRPRAVLWNSEPAAAVTSQLVS